MFFELLNQVFLESSFLYLYVGIILLTFGLMYFNHLYNKHFMHNGYVWNDRHQNTKINLSQLNKPCMTNESFIVWLIIICKRTDEKDDKEDSNHSYFTHRLKIRGGQLWKQTACSLRLRNIAI